MEENKYYTPSLDELYIGFECEKHDTYFNDSEPVSEYRQHIMCEEDFDMLSCYPTQYRVKYLDKEDLVELGFNPVKGVEVNMCNKQIYYRDQWCSVVFNYDRITNIVIQKNSFPVFNGVVKNKSELIKVLKMLGIK